MTKNNWPADRAGEWRRTAAASKPRWVTTALASAVVATCLSTATGDASALALGRITVLSALGEPLRAEIEVPEITTAEAESLRVTPATPAAFRAAGVEYSQTVSGLQVRVQRTPDGRTVLRVTGDRPVNDPFIDLILEANWASGRIVRDYTLLFDPPANRQAAAAIGAAPQTTAPVQAPRAQVPSAPPPAIVATPLPAGPAAAPRLAPPPPAPVRALSPTPTPTPAPATATGGTAAQVTVRPGDNASRVANATRPPSVSLDQMLVALLRSNPDAFIAGNVNRLRAGAVLAVPDAAQAQATPASEASQIVVAQSRDFNEYRRRLAGAASGVAVATPQRAASGQVQTQVEDARPAAAAPDKLTLSKGAVQGSNSRGTEERVAQTSQARDNAARMAELSKNINDLNRLNAATGAPAGAATVPAGSPAAPAAPTAANRGVPIAVPAVTAPAASVASPTPAPATPTPAAPPPSPAPAPAPATAPVSAPAAPAVPPTDTTPASPAPAATPPAALPAVTTAADAATATTQTPSATAPATSTPPAPPPAAAASAPATDEPGLLDRLREEPLLPLTIAGLLALLAGLGIYRARQRKKSEHVDSSFLESRLQPDSFFGASGGQRIDTNESGTTGSSMAYSPSQLDAGGDVDPVAEADVYLAYGRDLQAEEILKEALRSNPSRGAIHGKLLDIYNKRRDVPAFNAAAANLHELAQGQGSEWERVAEMGRQLDPANPLYAIDGSGSTRPAGLSSVGGPALASASAAFATPAHDSKSPLDLDLDLALPLDDAPSGSIPLSTGYSPSRPSATIDVSEPLSDDVSRPAPLAPLPPLAADYSGNRSVDFEPLAELPTNDEVPSLPAPLDSQPASAPASVDGGGAYDSDFDFMLEENAAAPLDTAPDSGLRAIGGAPTEPGSLYSNRDELAPAPDMLEFDLNSISLDLGDDTSNATTAGAQLGNDDPAADDPMATKLALAHEFNAIGDADGARALVEEVLAEASGSVKTKAQRLMAELG